MATLNQFQVFSGHFFSGEHYAFNDVTKQWASEPTTFRYKPSDISSQGVSASGKTTTEYQPLEGWVIGKRNFAISTTADITFKKKDKIKIANGEWFSISSVTEGYDSINALNNLQFPRMSRNKPHILLLN